MAALVRGAAGCGGAAAFRADLAARRALPTRDVARCARRGERVDPMDALRMAAGTIRCAATTTGDGRSGATSSPRFPTIVAAYWRLLHGREPSRRAPTSARRELPLHAHRRRPRRRARARAGDVSQHRRRSRPQRLDVHRARHRLDRLRSRLRHHRRHRRAEGTAARRRAGTGARHGLRDRRRRRAPRRCCGRRSNRARG